MFLATVVNDQNSKPETFGQKLKARMERRRQEKVQAMIEERIKREELKYLVKGLVRHIDGASEGCRMTREASLETQLTHSRLSATDKVMLSSGTLVMIGFFAARWVTG